MPDIHFINSPRSEEERLKFTEKVIRQGFYQRNGFVVLPVIDSRVQSNALVIYPNKFVYKKIETGQYQRQWDQINDRFWQELEEFLPASAKMNNNIEVRVSRYGTIASSEKWRVGAKKSVFYLREDVDISQLAAMIVNHVLYAEKTSLGITWSKREALMDFIMTRPGMKKLFPKFKPVMSQLSRVPATIRRESEKYLKSLGIEEGTQELMSSGGKILIKGQIVGRELSKLEKKIFKVMIDHQGELVSYDDLADSVWGEGEFKTFWAINKLVGRMRQRLERLGIEGKRVESIRGQGYLLR